MASIVGVGLIKHEETLKDGTVKSWYNKNILCEIGGRVFPDEKLDNYKFGDFIRLCLGLDLLESRGRNKDQKVEDKIDPEKKLLESIVENKELQFTIVEKEVMINGKLTNMPVKVYSWK